MQPHEQFSKILEICKSFMPGMFNSDGNLPHRGCQPVCSDITVIALSLFQEHISIGSELRFFAELNMQMPELANMLGSRRNYNTRRRKLLPYIEPLRRNIVKSLFPSTEGSVILVDSMPIESCRYARAKSCKILHDDEDRVPSFGYCATQEQKYFGYKFHCACTPSGLIYRYDLSQAHHHDIKYLHDLKDDISNCYLVGDKGYRSTPWRLTLFEYAGIELATPCRSNELLQYAMPEDYQRLRKRVEVVFSQLVDQFNVRKSYAKTQPGFFVRVISKVTLYTLLQYINTRQNQPISKTRYTLLSA